MQAGAAHAIGISPASQPASPPARQPASPPAIVELVVARHKGCGINIAPETRFISSCS
jgi:hypothetical protein